MKNRSATLDQSYAKQLRRVRKDCLQQAVRRTQDADMARAAGDHKLADNLFLIVEGCKTAAESYLKELRELKKPKVKS